MTAPPPKFSGNPEEILDHLLKKPELNGMELALYDEQGRFLAMRGGAPDFSGEPAATLLCGENCPLKQKDRIVPDRNHLSPFLENCPGGLWHYLQPCQNKWGGLHTLVVGGVRKPEVNLPFLENLAREKGLSASSLLELLDNIPAVSRREMLEIGRALRRYLSDTTSFRPAATLTPQTAAIIRAVAEIESGLAQADSPAAILELISEALSPHFTPEQIALFLPKGEDEPADWIHSEKTASSVYEAFDPAHTAETCVNRTTCLPLQYQNNLFGCMVLHAGLLSTSDHLLLKIIADRVAGRLEQLSNAPSSAGGAAIPAEYLLNKLEVLGTNRELRDLCRQILETAAQLAKARKGSLMLLEGNTGKLKLMASIGMNRALIEEYAERKDQSITNLVLHSGQPLLVTDLAKDPRIKVAPRPRFRTRSLLSLPLCSHQGLLGVLNLADKWDDNTFTQTDLSLLSPWAGYCAPLIERLANRQDIDQLRNEAAIDPLTGVYNQRLLEKRFSEEVSRANRSEQDLVLMLVAPDQADKKNPDLLKIREEEKALVKEIGGLLRKMDIIGRLESGIFAVLLPDTPRDGALTVGERLCLAVAESRPELNLTISCGLALYPRHGANFSALLKSAEAALKKAHSDGGNAPLFVDQIEKSGKIIYI